MLLRPVGHLLRRPEWCGGVVVWTSALCREEEAYTLLAGVGELRPAACISAGRQKTLQLSAGELSLNQSM